VKVQIRRSVAAAAVGAFAAIGAVALPAGSAGWEPVTYGLTATPDQLLPAVVSADRPARVVTTTVGRDGRPAVTVTEAIDRRTAARLIEDGQDTDDAVSVEVDAPVHAYGTPTGADPHRAQQWNLTRLKVDEAWKRSTGAGITVAVIDSGVDAKHPDLAGNVLDGYDAITDRAGPVPDANGHGTHVAGAIAAVTGNGTGIAGTAPDVKILPVRVLGSHGGGSMSDTAEGIVWATDHGAQVINLSLGSTTKVAAVTNAIAYARGKGVTVIAAAGRAGTSANPVSYPAADAGVIAVTATGADDRIAVYSPTGGFIDVAAPGDAILSTFPANRGSGYKYMSGTSTAAPHVAAAAALLKSANRALTPDQIETALEKTATDLGTPGFDNDYGNGRIDPVAALASLTPVTTPVTKTPTTTPTTQAPTTPPKAPTTAPTKAPTKAPTTAPTKAPTKAPTTAPTKAPTGAPATKAPTTAPATSAPSGVAAYEAQVIALTNEQRTANGCGTARTDDRLTAAARAHSGDMVAGNFFGHTGSDGGDFATRATRAGYPGASGENIAYGHRTPQEVVTGWMNSSGHRANILNCQSIAVGVGLVTKADGTPYWTQVFGRV
jgi:serine protease